MKLKTSHRRDVQVYSDAYSQWPLLSSKCGIKQSDSFYTPDVLHSFCPHDVGLNCSSTENNKKSKRDQNVAKRGLARHRETIITYVIMRTHPWSQDTFLSRFHVTFAVSTQTSVVFVVFQTQHCAVRHCVGWCLWFLHHDVLNHHVLQHYMFHPPQISFKCQCRCRMIVDMIQECHVVSHFLIVIAYNSTTAKLTLSDFCVFEKSNKIALLRCVNPPLVLSHVWCS